MSEINQAKVQSTFAGKVAAKMFAEAKGKFGQREIKQLKPPAGNGTFGAAFELWMKDFWNEDRTVFWADVWGTFSSDAPVNQKIDEEFNKLVESEESKPKDDNPINIEAQGGVEPGGDRAPISSKPIKAVPGQSVYAQFEAGKKLIPEQDKKLAAYDLKYKQARTNQQSVVDILKLNSVEQSRYDALLGSIRTLIIYTKSLTDGNARKNKLSEIDDLFGQVDAMNKKSGLVSEE